MVAFVLVGRVASAQWVVNDPALTGKSVVIAATQEVIRTIEEDKQAVLRRLGRSLSIFVSLGRYVVANIPQWRTWRQYDPIPEALAFMDALNGGVGPGVEVVAPARPALDPEMDLPTAVRAGLAVLDMADSVLVAGVDQTGRIRGARKSEREAFAALDLAVGSLGGSATARADVLSAAALMSAQQKQTRLALMAPMVEQLVVDAIRARQADTATLRMRQAALTVGPSVVEGAAADLRAWRQP